MRGNGPCVSASVGGIAATSKNGNYPLTGEVAQEWPFVRRSTGFASRSPRSASYCENEVPAKTSMAASASPSLRVLAGGHAVRVWRGQISAM